ncbi:MAG: AAA family ATPase [Marinobacter sp.]|nr:AAA family ATPase [Marinobacter sp.]
MNRTAHMRVTNVRFLHAKRSIFSGVLLEKASSRVKSAKVVIVVDVGTEHLPIEPALGQQWTITGQCEDRELEKQAHFKITESVFKDPESIQITMPADSESLIQFIAKEPAFPRIGQTKARELVEHFGQELMEILKTGDTARLEEVVTTDSAQVLVKGFEKYKNLRYSQWLTNHGIPLSIQMRLFKLHKEQSIDQIRKNPFELITFGLSFTECTKIAREKFGVERNDPRRTQAAVEQAVKDHCSLGHTVATKQDLKRRIENLLHSHNSDAVESALKGAVSNLCITHDPDTGRYHNTALLIMERVVAKRIQTLQQDYTQLSEYQFEIISRVASQLPYALTKRQLEAVERSLSYGLSSITGGAGTGKTTVLCTTLKCYRLLGYDIKAMALSGRAAMRLEESIGTETCTIAKFLREDLKDENTPTLIVVDEASMVDINYLYKLVLKTSPTTRVLLVGDPYQLPPIGPGVPFADILASGAAANTELDVVKRQDETTGIPLYSASIRKGEVPEELSSGKIYFHEVSDPEWIANKCSELYAQSPVESRVIAPTLKLTREINLQCQMRVNSNGDLLFPEIEGELFNTDFKCGDPVLFTKNDYDLGVQNGSLGRLISVEQTENSLGMVQLDDTGETIDLHKTQLDMIQLGYAITLHKAQGSQFSRIVIALSNSQMIERSWLYTAITRAEIEVHIVGSQRKFKHTITNPSKHYQRKTCLGSLLKPITLYTE